MGDNGSWPCPWSKARSFNGQIRARYSIQGYFKVNVCMFLLRLADPIAQMGSTRMGSRFCIHDSPLVQAGSGSIESVWGPSWLGLWQFWWDNGIIGGFGGIT